MVSLLRKLMLLLMMSLLGCSHSIHQVHVSSMDKPVTYQKGRWVSVDLEKFVILLLNFNTDYVETAVKRLEQACNGPIAQVTTESLTNFYFFSHGRKIVMKGFCVDT